MQWGVHQPSFSVYRGQVTPRRGIADGLPPGTLALTREDRLPPGLDAQVVFRERGYLLLLTNAR